MKVTYRVIGFISYKYKRLTWLLPQREQWVFRVGGEGDDAIGYYSQTYYTSLEGLVSHGSSSIYPKENLLKIVEILPWARAKEFGVCMKEDIFDGK